MSNRSHFQFVPNLSVHWRGYFRSFSVSPRVPRIKPRPVGIVAESVLNYCIRARAGMLAWLSQILVMVIVTPEITWFKT